MKKLAFLFLLLSAPGFCGGFGDFEKYADAASLKPFARDLGALLGSAIYHTGRGLGFAGFDVGLREAFQFNPSSGDGIMRRAGVKNISLGWIQGEIGMPFRLDGFVRGTNYDGLTVAGGGIRWSVMKVNDTPHSFQFMLALAGHAAVHEQFSAAHLALSAVGSWRLCPYAIPYLGVGMDRTRLSVKSAPAGSGLIGDHVTATGPRLTLGFNLKPAQFVYIGVAANEFFNGRQGLETSLGVRF